MKIEVTALEKTILELAVVAHQQKLEKLGNDAKKLGLQTAEAIQKDLKTVSELRDKLL